MSESLLKFNTFGFDIQCREILFPANAGDLKEIYNKDFFKGGDFLIIGSGSNILFTNDYPGIVIHLFDNSIKVVTHEDDSVIIEAGAGVIWDDLVDWAVKRGFGGIENLSLIPGTTGAAPVQNIGAYGSEIKDTLASVEVFDTSSGSTRIFTKKECSFSYRNSRFKMAGPGKYIVTRIWLKLTSGNHNFMTGYGAVEKTINQLGDTTLENIRKAVIKIRSEKLPDPEKTGNAGSFFKNPVITIAVATNLKKEFDQIPAYPDKAGLMKIPAAWLIEQCGWKGYRSGDAGVHDRQPLVLVNHGKATGKEIFELSEKIIESVKHKFGITLEREVVVI